MVLVTSGGFHGAYLASRRSLWMTAIAGEGTGMERDYDFASGSLLFRNDGAHLFTPRAVAVNPSHDRDSLVWEPGLVGEWQNVDDASSMKIERGEWQSYTVEYAHTIEKGRLTGYLSTIGKERYLDVMPARGEDHGSFLLPLHVVLRGAASGGWLMPVVPPMVSAATGAYLDADAQRAITALPEIASVDFIKFQDVLLPGERLIIACNTGDDFQHLGDFPADFNTVFGRFGRLDHDVFSSELPGKGHAPGALGSFLGCRFCCRSSGFRKLFL